MLISVVVDAQNGFTPNCPDELPILHGNDIVDDVNLVNALVDKVIFTKDNHPEKGYWEPQLYEDDKYPGIDRAWPRHCVVGTYRNELIDGIKVPYNATFCSKGEDPTKHPYGAIPELPYAGFNHTVIVTGLAGDYCVLETIKNIRKEYRQITVIAYAPGIRSLAAFPEQELRKLGVTILETRKELFSKFLNKEFFSKVFASSEQDTDKYKFSMAKTFQRSGLAQKSATYRLTVRDPDRYNFTREQSDLITGLYLATLDWYKTVGILSSETEVDIISPLEIIVKDQLVTASMLETFFINMVSYWLTAFHDTGKADITEANNILELSEEDEIKLIEMGTRRRISKSYHNQLNEKRMWNKGMTSNVEAAGCYHSPFVAGTIAHEAVMARTAFIKQEGNFTLKDLVSSQEKVWGELLSYSETGGIILTDTYTTDVCLAALRQGIHNGTIKPQSIEGFRHDSGDPIRWTEKIISFAEENYLTHLKLIYSDGWREKTLKHFLSNKLKGNYTAYFGVGTALTNPYENPISVVYKIDEIVGIKCHKISDNIAKATKDVRLGEYGLSKAEFPFAPMGIKFEEGELKQYLAKKIAKIAEYFKDKTPVLGFSGGVDSLVCLRLLQEARVECLPVLMPPSDRDEVNSLSEQYCKEKGLYYRKHPVSVEAAKKCGATEPLQIGNYLARMRMAALYQVASEVKNGRVVNTCNLSETMIGYETKYGDGAGDIALISELYKSQVYQLAELLEDKEWIQYIPTADLWEGQSDEDELGMSYDEINVGISQYISFGEAKNKKIQRMIERSKHKRELIPGI